ncbi:MAG: protoporphyrinogen oxidase [Myxococcales bacterium]|nr:protoporphyrinogen oxidase [Myxococcales bacterium]
MSRILIAFASHHGHTRKIAVRIGDHLRGLGHHTELASLDDGLRNIPPPEDYDVVVLGSRVEVGRHAPTLAEYVRANRAELSEMPTALFSVSMAAAGAPPHADPAGYLAKQCDQLAWTPTRRAAFGGGLPYRQYNWITRFVMKQISRRAGHSTDTSRDHDFTDWAAVRSFAVAIDAICPRVQHTASYV